MTTRIKQIVENSDTPSGKIFDLAIQGLILLSLATFCIATLPDLDAGTRRLLDAIEFGTVAIFTIEYLLRMAVADKKLSFIFSIYGLIDLAAITPFYVAPAFDLRSIRVLRMLRLLRILKMARYSKAASRFRDAFVSVKEELVLFLGATAILIFLASVGIYFCERDAQPEKFRSIFHAMWWTMSALTPLGIGSVYPITLGGRLFTTVILLFGLGLIAVPSGMLASVLRKD